MRSRFAYQRIQPSHTDCKVQHVVRQAAEGHKTTELVQPWKKRQAKSYPRSEKENAR